MESEDVFPDQMDGGPELIEPDARPLLIAVTQSGDVVGKGVEPDVHHMVLVIRDRNAPCNRASLPTDREVLQTSSNERQHLIPPSLRPDELRICLDDIR